jgi:hypothetical protein
MVVAIVGSSRFKDLILEYGKKFNLQGDIAIHSDVFTGADGYDITPEQVKLCVANGHRRIVMCDQLFVVNPNGYIGESTREEIEYAESIGREVVYMVNPLKLKLFISLPMAGRTDEEIVNEIRDSYTKAKAKVDKYANNIRFAYGVEEETPIEIQYINSICEEERTPMGYLAHSIEKLAEADIAYFADGYRKARGCALENRIAHQYETKIIIESQGKDESGKEKIKMSINS